MEYPTSYIWSYATIKFFILVTMNNSINWLIHSFKNLSSMLQALYTIERISYVKLNFPERYLTCINAVSDSHLAMSKLNLFEGKCNL